MKRFLDSNILKQMSLLLSVLLIIIIVTPSEVTAATTTIKAGDYIQFGKYSNKPIAWRVIDIDEKGNPLLFSTKVICEKAFDGDHLGEDLSGYCNWEDSNIRAWLNSEAEAGSVVFPCGHPPTDANLMSALFTYEGETDPKNYEMEAGFLSNNNFSIMERNLIKEVTQKNVISSCEKSRADGGTEAFKMSVFDKDQGYYLKDAISNYDSAYYENVTDKVFFLDLKQVQLVESKFGDFYKGFTALDNKKCDYFVRTQDGVGPDVSYFVTAWSVEYGFDGTSPVIICNNSHYGSGVRPALYLDATKIAIKSGSGAADSPYSLQDVPSKVEAVTTASKVLVNGKSVEFKAYNINGNNYFKLRDLAQALSGTGKQFDVTWDSSKNAINLLSSTAYSPVGGEFAKDSIAKATATVSTSQIYKDNALAALTAYNINGNNYFKLRDIAQAFNFSVNWVNDGGSGTINIDTMQ